jgi:3-methyladenine DNA glycosylase AlkC
VPALKDEIDASLVEALARELTAAWADYPAATFVDQASRGLEELELKDRSRHVARALRDALPDDIADVVDVFETALESDTFAGWMLWPVAELIGWLGPQEPAVVLPFMAKLTVRMSCEFAIRPCLVQHPELTFEHLQRWVHHPDERVRRLVSEGSRPRLPWGARLRALQEDPTRTLALLDQLRDDPSATVRRSVANHLGDIVKDHPALAIATAERWRIEGGEHVEEVVRHGLRTLIKAGDPAALRLIGYDPDAPVRLRRIAVVPRRLSIGDAATVEVELTTTSTAPVPVVVEYLVHFLGPRRPRKPKAFRLAERTLEPGEGCMLRRRHTFDHASIRTLYPGEHLVELQVNGRILGSCTVDLHA